MSKEPEKIYDSDPSEDTSWMLTYGDIITLLMIFFVLLFSTSKVSQEKFDQVAQSINESLNRAGPDPKTDSPLSRSPLAEAQEILERLIEDQGLRKQMTTKLTQRGLMIELSSNSFFDSGSAVVRASMFKTLEDLSGVIQNLPRNDYRVEIEGHTDNVPINTVRFPSNWELSALRSINVLHVFEGSGLPKDRITATAFAETKPKVPNTNSKGVNLPMNQAQNRRVVVFITNVEGA
ncbi:MAG: flagellar motor protein MotB [Pseudomonadales bacterium]|nr:flagellar motor protein MotB [Pseudomonadales bacterium]